jgi:hypothetical protein
VGPAIVTRSPIPRTAKSASITAVAYRGSSLPHLRTEALAGGGGVDPGDGDPLVAPADAPDDPDRGRRYSEGAAEESSERPVRRPLDRGSGEANDEGPLPLASEPLAGRPGLDADPQGQGRGAFPELERLEALAPLRPFWPSPSASMTHVALRSVAPGGTPVGRPARAPGLSPARFLAPLQEAQVVIELGILLEIE